MIIKGIGVDQLLTQSLQVSTIDGKSLCHRYEIARCEISLFPILVAENGRRGVMTVCRVGEAVRTGLAHG